MAHHHSIYAGGYWQAHAKLAKAYEETSGNGITQSPFH
jgi:hypothetical protein